MSILADNLPSILATLVVACIAVAVARSIFFNAPPFIPEEDDHTGGYRDDSTQPWRHR